MTTVNGKVYTGRLAGDDEKSITILTNPEVSTEVAVIPKEDVDEITPSKTSLMPSDLLKPLNEAEVLDLMAYLLSRGNAEDAVFQK